MKELYVKGISLADLIVLGVLLLAAASRLRVRAFLPCSRPLIHLSSTVGVEFMEPRSVV